MTVTEMPSASIPHCDGIQDVWQSNLEEEFKSIRKVAKQYPYVAMDTEFPGVVARPIGQFTSQADYQYQNIRCNVDLLKLIQVGITFFNEEGKSPEPVSTWQFNFKFNLSEDMYAQDSIDLLQNCGINFDTSDRKGIDVNNFAELLMTSGLVLSDNIKWISFHSGYDFGYMLKVLTNTSMPELEQDFFDLLKLYCPKIYDVKYLMKSCKTLKGGLQEVADQLEIKRVGPQHQAGSDSLLTGAAFFRMRSMFFEDNIDNDKYCGHLFGLGSSYVQNGNNSYEQHQGYGPPTTNTTVVNAPAGESSAPAQRDQSGSRRGGGVANGNTGGTTNGTGGSDTPVSSAATPTTSSS